MIIRIVKMTFEPSRVAEFLETFEKYKAHIRNTEGCRHLELLADKANSGIYFTYSHWDAEHYLEQYRNSELFKEVWRLTKVHFAAKPEAWSTQSVSEVR